MRTGPDQAGALADLCSTSVTYAAVRNAYTISSVQAGVRCRAQRSGTSATVNKANFIIVHLYGDGSAMLLCNWCNQLFIGRGHPEQCPLCHSAGKLVETQTEAS